MAPPFVQSRKSSSYQPIVLDQIQCGRESQFRVDQTSTSHDVRIGVSIINSTDYSKVLYMCGLVLEKMQMPSKYTTTKVNLSIKIVLVVTRYLAFLLNPLVQQSSDMFLCAFGKLCIALSCLRLAFDGILELNR